MEDLQSNKMRHMDIKKLLFSMSLPTIFSMFVQALYNIVDTMYVSQYSPDKGVEALAIAFPLQTVILAIFLGIGVGANAQIAKKLGANKKEEATATAKNCVFITLIAIAFFIIIGLLVPNPFMKLFTRDETVISMGTIYLQIVSCFAFGWGIQIALEKILQSTGNMKAPMIAQLIGALTNIILDPIFIFTLKLGITGAAVATIIGQFAVMFFLILQFFIKKQDVGVNIFKNFTPSFQIFKKIIRVGLPTMLMNSLASVTTTALNGILGVYPNGIRLLGIYFKLQSFVFMPIFGLMQGALPIMSYNYGYNDKKRFDECYKLSIITSLLIMVIGTIIFQCFPTIFLKLFNVEGEALSLGIICLRIISISFIPASFNVVNMTAFQAIGNGLHGLILSLLRQLIVLLPAAYLLSLISLNASWWCYSISEYITALIFIPLSLILIKKKFNYQSSYKSSLH